MESIAVGSISPSLVEQSKGLLILVEAYNINSQEMREAASEDLKRVKALYKQIDAQEKTITRPINDGLARVREMFAIPKGWLATAEDKLKGAALAWDHAEEQKRAKAAAEAARIADEQRRDLEAAAVREVQAGNTETAQAIVEAAAMVAPVPLAVAPKIAGESTREVWSAELVDIVAVCRGVAEGRIAPNAVEINSTFWNGLARSYKQAFDFPGMRAVCKKILASRTA